MIRKLRGLLVLPTEEKNPSFPVSNCIWAFIFHRCAAACLEFMPIRLLMHPEIFLRDSKFFHTFLQVSALYRAASQFHQRVKQIEFQLMRCVSVDLCNSTARFQSPPLHLHFQDYCRAYVSTEHMIHLERASNIAIDIFRAYASHSPAASMAHSIIPRPLAQGGSRVVRTLGCIFQIFQYSPDGAEEYRNLHGS